MSSDSHRRQAFELEGLEPRLLLSANGISGAAPAQLGHTDPLQAATVVSMFTQSIPTNSGAQTSENDLFDGVADEALTGPETPVIAPAAALENAASETPVSATETASEHADEVTRLVAATLATNLGTTSLTGQSDSLSDQLTTTLKAANGPPAGAETLSAEQIIPLSYDFSSKNSQPRVASAVFVPSDSSENTPTRSAAPTNYAGSHTFSGTTAINIAGKNPGEFDVITVSDNATLGGTLAITVSGNPSLQVGDTLTIITAGSGVTGAFANATGLFGFGDGSRYFAVVQDAGSVKLVVKQFPGAGLSFVADTTAGADALGQFLNSDYFASNQAATVAGGLSIASGVSVRGTFTFAQSSLATVDIATGLGKPLAQFTDAELSAAIKSQLTALGISGDGTYLNDIGMSVVRISASGAEGFVGETVNLGSAFGSQIRTGFLVKNMNLGIAVMTPTWSVAPIFPATSFVSAKATGAVEAIGFGGLMDFIAPSATIEVNTGTSFTSAANNAVVDFAKSFETAPGAANGSYTVGTTQLAFGGQTKVLVNLTNVSVTLLEILDLRGDFVFEVGPQKTVSVQTNVPANLAALPGFYETTLQQFVTAGLTVTGNNTGLAGLVVNTYRFSASNVSGFIGLGDPTFSGPTRTITNGSDLVGFGFSNLNLDIGLFGVESQAITKLGMPDFVALKGQVSSVDSYGMDEVLEMSAQGVTIAINTAAKFKGGIPLGTLDLPDFTLPTIELPNLLLPDLSLPTISLPQISLPTISLPDFNIPSLSLPSLSLPNLQIPTITLPSIDLPSIDLSNLIPTITLPNLTLPSITLPDLSLPTIDLSALRAYLPNPSLPNLTLPSLTLPDLIIPAIHLPDLIPTLDLSGLVPKIVFPTITFPTIQLPPINLPDLDLSAFGLPNLRLPALTLPSFTLPSITLPSINLPNLDIHLPSLPNFRIPAITLPDISLPAIHLPNLSLPNLDLSALHLFDLIFPDLSGIRLPNLTLPQISLPALSFPSLKFPNIDLSGIGLPNVSIPSFTLPNFALPTVNFPSLQLPNLYVPEFDLLRFRLPNLTLPTLTLPSISLPTLTLPDFDITFPEMPTLNLPDIHLPSISLPNLQLPSLNLPDIDLSLLRLPGIPRITLPTISLPSISLPSISLPDLHLPSLKLPDINVPSLADLPGIKLNKIGAPAIDFQASFGNSGLSVGGSALDFNGARRTTVTVAQVDLQLASALSLTGSLAFEFGPRAVVNVATGLPAALGPAAGVVQPFFNYLSSQAGLTIGQNFSTISGLEVESMTVGASNLTAFLGYGNPDLHADLSTQDITGFGISNLTFGLGIFKPTLPIKKLPSFTVLKATAGSFSTYGMDSVFDLQGTGLTIEVNTGTAWPAKIGTPVIDFTSSFPASGSNPVGFAVTIPAGAPQVYLDYDGQPRVAFGVQSATVNLADFIVLKGGIRVVMGPTYIVNIDTGIPDDLGVALGSIGLDSIASQLSSVAGVKIGPNFSTISGLEVRSMTIAGTNMSAWIGSTDYDFSRPLANQDVYGFKLEGLTFGLGIFTPNLPIKKLPKFTALTAHTDSFEFKGGLSNPFSLTGSDLTINLNTGTKWPGGIGTPVIDFAKSFETSPGAANGQFAVSTSTGGPIYLKFDGNERIGVSVGKATLQISEFVHLTGAFNFEKGPTLKVPLIAGVAGADISGLVPAQFGGTGYKEVSTMVVGGAGVHAFVGINGPYWVDANHNGVIDRDAGGNILAAETISRAAGLVIENLDFGLFIGRPTNLVDPIRYIGLKATANTVKLVGISGVTASANGISIDLNIATPTVGILPVLPVIDFSGLAGGKFTINTGVRNASGGTVAVDLAMKSALIRAQGFIALNVFNSVYLTGSVAFELGPTKTVNLVGGGTKTVSTMSIGVAHVNAFVGANGPYWVDSNRDKTVQNSELSSTAMGFSIADFTGGLLVMASTNPNDLGAYVALKATVASFGLVNMPAGISATGILDLDINVGVGLSGIDPTITAVDLTTSFGEAPVLFALLDANHDNRIDQAEQTAALAAGYIGQNIISISQLVSVLNASTGPPDEYLTISEVGAKLKASFKTSHQAAIDALDADGNGRLNLGYEVSTGDPTTPVLLKSEKFLISIQLAGQIRQTGVFRLNGAFLFEVDSSALKAFVAAGLEVGPDIGAATGSKIFTMNALGALVITSSGLAADLEVSASIGGALRNVLALNATARVVMNTTGVDQVITIPKRYAGYVTGAESIVGTLPGSTTFDPSQAASLAGKLTGRFTTNADGSLRFTIDRRAPRLGGGFDPAGPYFMVALHGDLTIARTFVIRADFQLKVSAAGLQLGYNGQLDLGGFATVNVVGGAVIENGVFATFARLSIDITVSGIRISGSADFEINSGTAAKTAYDALGQARTIAGTTYMVTVNATINLFNTLTATGTVKIGITNGNFLISVNATLNFFGFLNVGISGYINTNGTFSFTGSMGLDLTAGGFGIRGSLSVTLNNSGVSGSGSVSLVIAGQNINLASGTVSVNWTTGAWLIRAEGPLSVWLEVSSNGSGGYQIDGGLGFFDDVLEVLEGVADAIADGAVAAANAIADAAIALGGAIVQFGQDVVNFFEDVGDAIANAAEAVWDAISGFFEDERNVITEYTVNPRDYYLYSASLAGSTLTINNGTGYGSASQLNVWVVGGNLVVDAPDYTRTVPVSSSQHQERDYEWDGWPPWGEWSDWYNVGQPTIQYANITVTNASAFALGSVSKIVIVGTNGSETIVVDRNSVAIDTDVYANGGNDVVATGRGNDRVWGGDGDDVIFTYDGNDQLFGENHNDKLFGGVGTDYYEGGAGNDMLDENKDRLNPGTLLSETNTMYGGSGEDTILGSPGRDTIIGGSGDDILLGLSHDDVYIFDNSYGTDNLVDFTGKVTLDFSGVSNNLTVTTPTVSTPNGPQVRWSATSSGGNLSIDYLTWLDLLKLGSGSDTVNITKLPGRLLNITDAGARDTVTVDDSADTVNNTGVLTSTRITGLGMSTNADQSVVDSSQGIAYSGIEDLVIKLGSGNDTFTVNSTTSGTSNTTILSTGSGTDTIHLNGASNTLTINGQDDIDTINVNGSGAGSAVTLNAGNGADVINFNNTSGTTTANGESGADLFNVNGTGAGSSTTLNGGDSADIYNVKAIAGATTINGGNDDDTINVGSNAAGTAANPNNNSGGTVDNIGATLTISGDASGNDVLNVDDTGDANANSGTLTLNRITGLDMAGSITYQTIEALNISLGTGGDTFNVQSTAAITLTSLNTGLGAAANTVNLGSLTPSTGGNLNSILGKLIVSGQSSSDTINVDDTGDGSANTGTLTATRLTGLGMGDDTKGLQYAGIETLNISAGTGGDTINVQATSGGTVTTINTGTGTAANIVNLGSVAPATPGNVNAIAGKLNVVGQSSNDTINVDDTADTAGNVGTLTGNRLTGLGMGADSTTLGLEYTTIETFNLQLGQGGDVLNIRGTTAVTNTYGNGGDDRVYVSSLAAETLSTATDFLRGNLDQILGTLNLDLGTGTHVLMISDEGSTVGKGTAATPVRITDQPVTGGGIASSEVTITQLTTAPGITYKASATGNFGGGVTFWLGSGNDVVSIDGTHHRGDGSTGSVRTATTLNTGAGNDTVTASLNGSDGFFAVNTQAGDDAVDAATSTRPLVIFGGAGKDTITGGSANDIIFGDNGLVTYYNGVNVAAVFGNGGTGDKTDGVERPLGYVTTTFTAIGDNDIIGGGAGSDLVLGGTGDDSLDASATDTANDIVVGDNGDALFTNGLITQVNTTSTNIGGNDTLTTGKGTTIAFGGVGSDAITAGVGSSILVGDNGTAKFDPANGRLLEIFSTAPGDAGQDVINTGDGNNVIIGGSYSDLITAGNGNDIIVGDNGRALFDPATYRVTSITTTAPDQATGAGRLVGAVTYDDVIDARTGDNIVLGGSGADLITTQTGDDILVGDNGNATFDGTGVLRIIQTSDVAFGGDDRIVAGTGADVVLGGIGADDIDAGSEAAGDVSRDVLVGDNGRAEFDAAANLALIFTTAPAVGGNDTMLLGGGNNVAIGGVGSDAITGGTGNDIIVGDNGSAAFDATTHVAIDVHTTDATNAAPDTIVAGEGNNIVLGGTGNDSITTGAGSDVIVGDNGIAIFYSTGIVKNIETNDVASGGDDTINAGNGTDVVFGGSGNDLIDSGSVAAGDVSRDIVLGDNGHADFDSAGLLTLVYSTATSVGGNDSILIGAGDNVAIGGVGLDTITAGEGHDIIVGDNGSAAFDATSHVAIDVHTTSAGDAGVDTIEAGEGNNIVFGGSANDTITTGAGADVVVGDNGIATFYGSGILRNIETSDAATGGDDTINTGLGADVVFGGSGKDTIDSGSVLAGDISRDVAVGDNGHADFDAAGNLALVYTTVPATGGDDTILIGGGDNVAFGGVGNDEITAGDGRDIIAGDNGSALFDSVTHALIDMHTTDAANAGVDLINAANGDNVIFGGTANDTINTGNGADVAVGDNGTAAFYATGILRSIETSDPVQGGDDIINTGTGADVVFGGSGKDTIDSGSIAAGDVSRDVVAGDNGHADFDSAGNLALIYTTVPATGDNDTILIGAGNNVAFGGVGNDEIAAGDGDDIIVGDNGSAAFDSTTHAVVDAHTTYPANAGTDLINAANGNNVILAGSANDTVNTGTGADIVVGDNGRALFDPTAILRVIETIDPTFTGDDLINTGTGPDVVLGGNGSDQIDSGSVAAGDISRDVVVGDNGRAEFDAAGNLTFVTTTDPAIGGLDTILIGAGDNVALGGVADDSITAGDGSDTIVGDNGAATFHAVTHTLANIHTSDPLQGGVDTILAGNGNNVVLGGSSGDTITTGVGDDIVLGDNGYADYVVADGNPADLDVIASTDFDIGGIDTINTDAGSDIVIGGQAADVIDASTENNIVFGDSARIVAATADALNFSTQPFTLGRLETLAPGIGGADQIKTGLGRDIIVGGTGADTITANVGESATTSDGDNIVLGDDGFIDFVRAEREPTALGGDTDPSDLDVIASSDYADGAADVITTGNGSDIVIGGQAGDTILAGHGSNLVIGDSGIVTAATENLNRYSSQPMTVGRVETTAFGVGGMDGITTGSGNDIVLGGHDNDTINAGEGDNLVAGDDAVTDYVRAERAGVTPGADVNAVDIDYVTSLSTTAAGGADTINTGSGNDIVLGGRFGDTITAGAGNNLVIGDSGAITAANEDANRFSTLLFTIGLIESITFHDGGADTITTLGGNDVVLGGNVGDTINAGEGANVVIGDDATIDYVRAERAGTVPGADTNAGDIDLIASLSTTANGGIDDITTGAGNDLIVGGRANDTIRAGEGNNLVIGDSGQVTAANDNANRFSPAAPSALTVGLIETTAFGDGGVDTITTGAGSDAILGGHDADVIDAGNGDNLVIGDDALIDYVRLDRSPVTPGADASAADIDYISSTSTGPAGGADRITTGTGNDLIVGGRYGDTINAGTGSNYVSGDSVRITAADSDATRFGSAPLALITFGRVETIQPGDGGDDTITTGIGRDTIFGGTGSDNIVVNTGETATTPDADNIIVGDDGFIEYTRADRELTALGADADPSDIDFISSLDFSDGGNDTITTGNGNDIVVAGQADDRVTANQGSNIVIGDSGIITAATENTNRFATQPIALGLIETTAFGIGGIDNLTTGDGNDIVLGGDKGDVINAGHGDNLVTGDDAAIDFTRAERSGAVLGADLNAADIDYVTSLSTTAAGGADTINTGSGNDILIGGRFGDAVTAGAGNNVVIGDSGVITAATEDANRFSTLLFTIGLIESITFHDGGADTITTLGGNDVVLGGNAGDTVNAGEGANVVIGDDAVIDYVRAERDGAVPGADTNAGDIDLIASLSTTANGGIDDITTGAGNDLIVGGRANDTIRAGEGNNLVIGDSGQVTAANDNANRFSSAAATTLTVGLVETITFGDGGSDSITTGAGIDVILGGHDSDTINAGNGDNLVFGDDGLIEYVRGDRGSTAPGADINAGDIDYLTSTSTTAAGGADTITTGTGNDIVVGGRFGDTITADSGNNIVVGDSATITAANEDVNRFSTLAITVGRIETIEPTDGGADTITTLGGNDIVLGGDAGDTINAGNGNNVVGGDDAAIDFTRVERDGAGPGADTNAGDIDLILSLSTTAGGGADSLTTGSGNDLLIGGRFSDTINAGEGNNLAIGDSGRVTAANDNANRFSSTAATTLTVGLVETMAFGDGGADAITTGNGIDVILGGHDADTINAGNGDNLVFGDDGLIEYVRGDRGSTAPGADINASDIDFLTSTSTTAAGGVDNITTGTGNDIVIGGRFGDTIAAGNGRNDVIGDSGFIIAATEDANRFSALAITVGRIETMEYGDGGADMITTLEGNDVILGGHINDTVNAGDGDNVVLGDDGAVEYVRRERDGVTSGADTNAADIDYITSLSTTAAGGADSIVTGSGNDIIIGGRFADTINGGNGNNIALGDSATITAVNEDAPRFGTQAMTVGRVETIATSDGGADEIRTGTGQDIVVGGAAADRLDSGAGDDLVVGDNEILDRTGRVGNFTNFLFEALTGTLIYDNFGNLLVNDLPANQPGGAPVWGDMTLTLTEHSLAVQTSGANSFGNDYIAGGADNDRIFGGLGEDIIQGDGSIDLAVAAGRLADGTLQVNGSVEAATDGDDYIEGNGGNDLIFGGLGQDDIIGGSSNFFGLTTPAMRPDASDLIFGGAGTDLAREDAGDISTTGRARDADTILGDNGIIIRLVGTNNVAGANYLGFNYDTYGALKIIARGVEFLDYTPGGIDLSPNAVNDIGAADEIHGESGNDTIYSQLGNDVVFGEAQDDDIVGGTGADWIGAGNGDDGVLGDDGRLYTSRNGTAEPLYGIAATPEGGLNLEISTPGDMQLATINIAGALKKTAILEPFMLTNTETVAGRTPSNDIVFGGLGNDSLHGGAGDDAVSGAEALPGYYAKPVNPGNILGFGLVRAGEFAAYDEYNPRTKIYVNPTTFEFVAATAPGAVEFILNFVATEQDGQDVIFGDVGNDWLVGGMGRDHIYGGYGDDLLNADDTHETNGGLNTAPDGPDSNQEDLAFGGAGRDVLIANTGGDRLIDWAGEFNSYIVPFSNFGAATISRTLNPQLAEFLYDLSASDGADPTRAQKTGSSAARNGEPEGELGLVRQQDFDWGDQTGAPADPQPGNIPGGKRDVIRSADFNNGSADDFSPDVGTWQVINGAYQVAPSVIGGDAVSLFNTMNVTLPRYFELQATVTAVKPTAGYKGNGYIIFDYQSPTDFKFAGINVSTNKLEIGHRTATGWVVDATRNMQLKDDTGYNMLLSINGLTAVLVIDNSSTNVLTFTFGARVVDGYSFTLNSGLVGIGGAGARARIDNVRVQVLPPTITFTNSENFSDSRANLLVGAQVGGWAVSTSGASASLGSGLDYAAYNSNLGLGASSVLMFDTTVRATASGTSAGVVFDYYDSSNFKFAAIVAGTNQLVIGHHTKSGWSIDTSVTVSQTLASGTSYTLALTLKGTTVSVLLNPSTTPSGQQVSLAAAGYVYNAVITDGQAGLFSRGGASIFSSYLVKTDDPRLLGAVFNSTGSSSTAGDAVRRQEG